MNGRLYGDLSTSLESGRRCLTSGPTPAYDRQMVRVASISTMWQLASVVGRPPKPVIQLFSARDCKPDSVISRSSFFKSMKH